MFNLGTSEIVIILVVALLVLGPAKLPELGKQIGQMLREFRKMSGDVQHALDLDGNYRNYDTEYSRSSSYDYQHDEPRAIEEHRSEEPKAVEAFSYSAPKQGAPVAAIDTRHDEEMTNYSVAENHESVEPTHTSEATDVAHVHQVHNESETTNAEPGVKPSAAV